MPIENENIFAQENAFKMSANIYHIVHLLRWYVKYNLPIDNEKHCTILSLCGATVRVCELGNYNVKSM